MIIASVSYNDIACILSNPSLLLKLLDFKIFSNFKKSDKI